ncbi:MAG: type III polyketide synthase [bacterium]
MEIYGIGTAVPEHSISQMDSAVIARDCIEVPADKIRIFDEIYRRSGVKKRHSVVLDASEGPLETRQSFYQENRTTAERMKLYESHAGPLALAGARKALENSQIEPSAITHIVSVSCTGFYSPGFDIALIKGLSLNSGVARTHIGFMGCQGAMNALRVAHGFVASSPKTRVLLCATELCSIHQYAHWDAEKIVANALFADGSASVVLGSSRRELNSSGRLRMIGSGATLINDSLDAMSWKIADHGFEMTLSSSVPQLIAASIRPWMEQWLSQFGLNLGDIGSWAVHPGGPRILSAFAEAMEIPKTALDHSFATLASYGNISSATVLFIMNSIMEAGPGPGFMVAVAFGPGLTVEAALFEIQDFPTKSTSSFV